jgi:hypothetical protein
MSQARLAARALRTALFSGLCAGAVIGASIPARAMETGNAATQPRGFYAYSGEASGAGAATTYSKHDNCFTTNSAIEATRAIRHWHGCR